MRFERLRLTGFKSFVDPADLVISPGLTGIVGPNGCGKSNLLEAIRWVMGESSYKSMRASGMDDVIFSGTRSRPGRNRAEVILHLDNAARTAPAAFNDTDRIEISRRIDREAGSTYRINGKEARARDVQLLFADASTGARSPSLVRQGQISELISAKPQARRRILEEAAGIAGLHARRHEAELRLRAAEANLTRLDDVIGELETRLSGLKRQARQAKRYTALSGEIRNAEATRLYLRWREAADAVEAEERDFSRLHDTIREQTRLLAEATRTQTEIAATLPGLREAEASAAAALQRLTVERDGLDAEIRRAHGRSEELKTRIEQIEADLARERETLNETGRVLENLDAEDRELADSLKHHERTLSEAEAGRKQAAAALSEAEATLDRAAQAAARVRAQRGELEKSLAHHERHIEQLGSELASVTAELSRHESGQEADNETTVLNEAVKAAAARLEAVEKTAIDAEAELARRRDEEAEHRALFTAAERDVQKLRTEIDTLRNVLKVSDDDLWPPLIDAVEVDPGYESALGAALGDELDASTDTGAPAHWKTLDPVEAQPLPEGIRPLSDFVRAPDALHRRLGQIGIADPQRASALQPRLAQGQRLVSLEGALWRWDGYTQSADAPGAAGRRLAQRNRLAELEGQAKGAEETARQAKTAFEKTVADVRAAEERAVKSREEWRRINHALGSARDALSAREREASDAVSRIGALREARGRLEREIARARTELQASRSALEQADAPAALERELESLREGAAGRRAEAARAQATLESVFRDAETRQARQKAIAAERRIWTARSERATAQIETLDTRHGAAREELAQARDIPGTIEDKRAQLADALSKAGQARNRAADALAEAENRLAQCDKDTKAKQDMLAQTREQGARSEARLEAARERQRELGAQIAGALECTPDQVVEKIGLASSDKLPGIEQAERTLERLNAERDRLGGVNLGAEREVSELSERLAVMVAERDDLIGAISRFRKGISSLNKEGRQRLLDAFEKVNVNFEKLFTTLFGGGKAKLELTESDDPLEAGLEIMARPPGKRLQVISLLSGGEKALTAIALVFAIFLTNPSPICVLDEVDAPLDDANVHRFCDMLDDMSAATDTRFLIITHHPYTMARMDRLFGVTMGERGVSQLVSVDLGTAREYRKSA